MPSGRRSQDPAITRSLLSLAVPAFLALVAEPLFLLVDAAVVGHLGTVQLAGLGIASVVVRGGVGLCVFLAYGTTAAVARQIGAGNRRSALTQGVDGLWLAVALGIPLAVLGLVSTGPLVAAFDASTAVEDAATTYLRLAWLGAPAMLLTLAATGVLRGLHDARTPLEVAVAANVANVVLNVVLVFGLGPVPALGLAGSALGTDIAQLGSAIALTLAVVRLARREAAGLRPDYAGVRRSARAGGPLVVRTLTLQACLVTMVWASAQLGPVATATHQVATSVWTFLAYALDAVAIAAQTITGTALGAGDVTSTRRVADRLIRIGWLSGVITGILLALSATVLGQVFTDDPEVARLLGRVLLVAACFQPLAGVVFVLDGVLIGAGDGRYLALSGAVVTALFVPAAVLVVTMSPGLVQLWLLFGVVFIGGRAAVLLARARDDRWLVPGS